MNDVVKSDVAKVPVSIGFNAHGKAVFLYFASATDHIAKVVASTSDFYERELLEFVGSLVSAGARVVDVGANVGNHTVYFAKICGCQVEAFEPFDDALELLRLNLRTNDLDSLVTVHSSALSDKHQQLSVVSSDAGNLGATRFGGDETGEVQARRLDEFTFASPVALLKIDAEGMDIAVVRGASETIGRDRPIVICEAAVHAEYEALLAELATHGYEAVACFNATDTYVFLPYVTPAEREFFHQLSARRAVELQRELKGAVSSIGGQKRSLDRVAHEQRVGLRTVQDEISSAKTEVSSISAKLAEVESNADLLRVSFKTVLRKIDSTEEVLYGEQVGRLVRLEKEWANHSAQLQRDVALHDEQISQKIGAFDDRLKAETSRVDLALQRATDQSFDVISEFDARLKKELQQLSDALETVRRESMQHALGRAELQSMGASLEAQLADVSSKLGAVTILEAQLADVSSKLQGLDEISILRHGMEALSNEVALAKSGQASLRSQLQGAVTMTAAQQSGFETGVNGRFEILLQRLQQLESEAVRQDARFSALMDGRMFSTLRKTKQTLMKIIRPFARSPEASAVSAVVVQAVAADTPIAPAGNDKAPAQMKAAMMATTVAPSPSKPVPAVVVDAPVVVAPVLENGTPKPVSSVKIENISYTSRKGNVASVAGLDQALPESALISVVMTTFNTKDYVEAAVRSILEQSHSKLELIVVDDGSNDGTLELLEAMRIADKRLRVFSFGVNRGTYWCKNFGITKAKGVAITFMDSDDTSAPSRLAEQYKVLREPGCAVSTCLHERRTLGGELVTVAGRTKRLAYISQMMRRQVFDAIGYFDCVRTSADDGMLRRIKVFVGATAHRNVDQVLYHAVVRENSLTQDPQNKGISAQAGDLSVPRKAYSEAVDAWHDSLARRGRYPYLPFPLVRRPFPIHERLRVDAGGNYESEFISVCVASFPPREQQLKQVVASLIDQVDRIFVYLNDYVSVPDYLKHPRIEVRVGGEDLRDNGKFAFSTELPAGYCFTVDDDIVYPPDYVQAMIRKVEIYGRLAAVGLHGTIFAKPFVSYFEGRKLFHFKQSLDRDELVDQLGTGTLCFHTSLWNPSHLDFSSKGMVDAWIAVAAVKAGIPLVAVSRKRNWLMPIPDPAANGASTLFDEFKNSCEAQTALINSVSGWGQGMSGAAKHSIEARIANFGSAFAREIAELNMQPASVEHSISSLIDGRYQRQAFKLAIVGRTDRHRWKKGGILKSTHLTADMLRPLGVEVQLVDLETGDPRGLNGQDADIVMIYPGDPERPDFAEVIKLVDIHASQGRAVLVNLSLNGRLSRKRFICEQMTEWRKLYGTRVGAMVFSDRVGDDPLLASVADLLVAIPKTLSYEQAPDLGFHQRDGIFLGDYGKLCDDTLVAWRAEEVIEALQDQVPEARLFCVEQYRPKRARNLAIEMLPFLGEEYTGILSSSRLMVSLVKYATFEMVPMELAAMGVPVLHPKMDNSLSDYLGLGAIEVRSVSHLAEVSKVLYRDQQIWEGVSSAGSKVAFGLSWEKMGAQMYLRLLAFWRNSIN
ncbi:MAG: FkbM family methyltransferase [Stenotrophomonas sp.]